MKSLSLVLAAAGSSTRVGLGKKKEYLEMKGGTVLSCAARIFLETADFSTVVIAIPKDGKEDAEKALFSDPRLHELLEHKNLFFVEGGSTRQSSVFKAIKAIPEKNSIVLIHDAARPFVSEETIKKVIAAAERYGASVPAIAPVDTQKEISPDGTIKRHLVRKNLCAVQTPQAFILAPLLLCHEKAAEEDMEFTDDTEIWDNYPEVTDGKKVFVVEGSKDNKKITFIQDIPMKHLMTKIGIGTDLHRLVEGRKFYLGGIEIPSEKGEDGHSDGDVLLHAISDALLGASGLGDIGSYFPPDEPQWKDADSKELLRKIWKDISNEGWRLNNLDCVVETEKPKLLPWREKIIESIANVLEVSNHQVFVKAKTNEKQDSVGEGNAIKAYCVCLLERNE
ncbi:2-C-methyl-D-erythritol 2,4-cyclodiphosphate synthase [Treponema sp.]|uniref:2-C-methyl-D-erythritol 2,4-cyclodiphosphate synthase n=1 Tax=Treponema sp. TaxID=166 RepID=UPI00388CFADD